MKDVAAIFNKDAVVAVLNARITKAQERKDALEKKMYDRKDSDSYYGYKSATAEIDREIIGIKADIAAIEMIWVNAITNRPFETARSCATWDEDYDAPQGNDIRPIAEKPPATKGFINYLGFNW